MDRRIGRDDIEDALNTLALLYKEYKPILNENDRQALCHTHRVIEALAKSHKYRPTKEYETVDIDVDMTEFQGGVISSVADQNAYWCNNINTIDLEQ